LVLAAAALSEVTARWLGPFWRGLFNTQQLRPRKMFFHLDDLGFNDFTNEHERNEHDKIVHTSDAFAAKRNVVNGQTQPLADLKWHKPSLKSAGRMKKIFRQRSYFALRAAMAASICSK
jgi:hypothetical protein